MSPPAVFFDRDGVLIADEGNLTDPRQVRLLPGAAEAASALKQNGFIPVVVTNQPVVARGWITERQLQEIHKHIQRMLGPEGTIAHFFYCPHHPHADLPEYRQDCGCRKPRPGMLLRAANELDVDLNQSFMIGDRITDILAGHAAGCQTVLLETGRHQDPPIVTAYPIDRTVTENYRCRTLMEAIPWILERSQARRSSYPRATELG
jgi:D-glycero-D-manno-heptose 1,7-bisphosphate phosphatase